MSNLQFCSENAEVLGTFQKLLFAIQKQSNLEIFVGQAVKSVPIVNHLKGVFIQQQFLHNEIN